jgi:Ca2+-binding RTX toxin-like protein
MPVSVQFNQSVDTNNGNIVIQLTGTNLPSSFPVSLNFNYTASLLNFDTLTVAGSFILNTSSVSNGVIGMGSISGTVAPSSLTFATIQFHGSGEGTFNLDVSNFDIAGSAVSFTDPSAIIFDFSAPTALSFTPTDATTSAEIDSNIDVLFNEPIQRGTGLIQIHTGSEIGPVIESYNAATSTMLTITGNTLTINPAADFANSTHYFVTLDAGSVKDIAGNSYAGSTSYDFTTTAYPQLTPMFRNSISVMPVRYTGPATAAGGAPIHCEFIGDSSSEVLIGTANNDFINVAGGVDAVDAGSGNDVIDGGTGSNFLTGGAGTDIFFCDGRGGVTIWSTITDWQAGEQLSVWGWTPGTSRIVEWVRAGAVGYEGLTMHADLNGDGTIDTSVTFTGITSQSQLPTPLEFAGLLWFT